MSLNKCEIKNVTKELHDQWVKENMWFEFYKPNFYVPTYCDFSTEVVKEMKEEYDNEKIETIWVNDCEELFNHEKILNIINNLTFSLIRFYTNEKKLMYDFKNDQNINGFGTGEVGRTSAPMLDLINKKITLMTMAKYDL